MRSTRRAEITIGEHVTRTVGRLTFNLDTIWTTLIAGASGPAAGLPGPRALTRDTDDHVPTKLQLFWETIVNQVNTQVEDNLGRVHPYVTPLAISLFFFILFANWLELLPTELNHDVHLTPAPTADTNLTYAMAILVMVSVWVYGIRQKGVKGYFKHFVEPFPILLPLNILEELIKPLTLALRLFGNIFAGGIMLALIGLLPFYVLWATQRAVEGLRHGHRRHPGLHLRPADRPLLRDGRCRPRRRARGRARGRARARRSREQPPFPRPDHPVGPHQR